MSQSLWAYFQSESEKLPEADGDLVPDLTLPTTSSAPCRVLEKTSIQLQNAVIKGYHSYKIRPPMTPTELIVDREYTNISDVNACLVWVPPLESFPKDMQSMVTDNKRMLMLSDIAGLPVGHVPRGLAGVFRSILDGGGNIFALATGDPIPSFPPWPAPNEIGGGVVIPADYVITTTDGLSIVSELQTVLEKLPEGSAMKVVV